MYQISLKSDIFYTRYLMHQICEIGCLAGSGRCARSCLRLATTRSAAATAALLAERGVRLEVVVDEGGEILVDGLAPLHISEPVALVGTAEKVHAHDFIHTKQAHALTRTQTCSCTRTHTQTHIHTRHEIKTNLGVSHLCVACLHGLTHTVFEVRMLRVWCVSCFRQWRVGMSVVSRKL